MSNNDEMSEMGSLERETRRKQLLEREQQRLERQARLAELNVPIEERMPRFEEQEPVADVGDNLSEKVKMSDLNSQQIIR
jgi:hypothetical protein